MLIKKRLLAIFVSIFLSSLGQDASAMVCYPAVSGVDEQIAEIEKNIDLFDGILVNIRVNVIAEYLKSFLCDGENFLPGIFYKQAIGEVDKNFDESLSCHIKRMITHPKILGSHIVSALVILDKVSKVRDASGHRYYSVSRENLFTLFLVCLSLEYKVVEDNRVDINFWNLLSGAGYTKTEFDSMQRKICEILDFNLLINTEEVSVILTILLATISLDQSSPTVYCEPPVHELKRFRSLFTFGNREADIDFKKND